MSSEPKLPEDVIAFSVKHAASLVGVSRATLYNAKRRGDLRMGRLYGKTIIQADELRAFWRKCFTPID